MESTAYHEVSLRHGPQTHEIKRYMNRTPDKISKERQRLGREIAGWQEKITAIHTAFLLRPAARAQAKQQVAFCEKEIKECRKRMAAIRHKGKKPWTFKQR